MKKWLIALFILISATASHSEQFAVTDFSGGLNTQYSPITIADNEVQDSLNVYFDEDHSAVKRQGFDVCGSSKSYVYDSAWSYKDTGGISWLIVRSSESILASQQGCNFNVVIATVSATDLVNGAVALNSIWFTDRTQGVYYFNGTSTTYVSGSPRGELITEYRERVCVSGLSSPNGNDLYCSAYLDGTNWNTASTLATGAVLIRVGLNDTFDVISAIFSGYNDSMQIWKNKSMYALYGFDKEDFQLRILSREVGCVDGRTVQPYMGGLVFGSERGIEFFNGVSVQTPPISDKIDNLLDNLRPASLNTASWPQTTQSDFDAGGIDPSGTLSTSISPGSVVPSSFSALITNDEDWDQGSLGLGTLDSENGSLIVKGTNGGGAASTFQGSFESDFGWSPTMIANRAFSLTSGCMATPYNGSFLLILGIGSNANLRVEECISGTQLCSVPISGYPNDCSWNTITCTGDMDKKSAKIKLTNSSGSTVYTSSCTIVSGSSVTIQAGAVSTSQSRVVDNLLVPSYQSQTYTHTSQVFDTGVSSPLVTANFSRTIDDITPTFLLQHSSFSTGGWSDLTTSSETNHWSKRYLRFKSTFTFVEDGGQDIRSSLDEVSIVARSTGTYFSAVHNAPNFSSWLQFNPLYSNGGGGAHSFFIRAAMSPFTVMSSTPAWTAVSPNTQITSSTGTYFQIKDSFTITAATAAPTLDSFVVNWIEGNRRLPMASITIDNRYYLSVSTYTSNNVNSATLVLSPGPVWSLWNIGAGAFVKHVNNHYFTNSVGDGTVNSFLVGTNDSGRAINAFVKTKDYPLGDITKDKTFDSLYVLSDSLGPYELSSAYSLNKTTTTYSLGTIQTDETSGLINSKLNFPLDSSHPNFGKTISLRFSNDESDQTMRVYGGILNFKTRRTE